MMETANRKPRLEWLDALRGFTMIMVVAYHVCQQGFMIPEKVSASMPFLVLFRMPLFFFVSGFLAYKANLQWNLPTLGRLIGKKMRVQLIPTAVFFLFAACVIRTEPTFLNAVETMLRSTTKGGDWFTLALLYMFIIYYLFSYVESKLHWRSWVPITLLFVVSLLAYESCYLPRYFWWAFGHRLAVHESWLHASSLFQVMQYFPFFIYGNIVRRYWEQSQKVMDSRWFYPVIIIIVIFCTLDVLKWHTMRMAWANLPTTLAKFILLTIVFMYFRHYHQYFTKMTWIGRSLQYIGRRTLDIYLIHFLFMPNLPGIGSFFNTYRHNFIMDTTLSVLLGLVIIGFSIITSNILRVSPLFKKYLFGRS
ncbi:MAG: acyltransferase [Prevotella sp.]|nr:acyltransferase [Prevotella sp.]